MAQWNGLVDRDPQYYPYPVYQEAALYQPTPQPFFTPPSTKQTLFDSNLPGPSCIHRNEIVKVETPRELRNRAEKQRRDKLNKSIAELAALVPPVVAASRKIDKTGVLRLTAHYLRAHQYVFGDAMSRPPSAELSSQTAETLLRLLNGFLLTTTYRGLVVVVSRNVQQYLGYSELDLLGQNIFNIIHEDDQRMMREQLMPKIELLGPNGELLVPEDPEEKLKMEQSLANEKKNFMIRFKKLSQRSEPDVYLRCHVQGSLRKSDRACRRYSRCCQIVRRARARGDNPCSSGNDVVFIGMVRPTTETFITEREMEAFNMEYRTRHSVDGQIIQCEQRISLVTGYMSQEVNGVNAMNFMHRDDVRWVIIALREMYDEHRVFGESCYRLMMKNGQFIYLKTRGCLEVDKETRVVTSFVCTNTVVGEEEGRHLNLLMKKKFAMLVNNNGELPQEDEFTDVSDQLPVEDPRNLEKVILHLVTNLPSPHPPKSSRGLSPDNCDSHLAIIPPRKERILSAIKKIYSVINNLRMEKKQNVIPDEMQFEEVDNRPSTPGEWKALGEATLMLPPRPYSVSPTPSLVSPFGTPRRTPRGHGHFAPISSRTSSQDFINLRRQIEGPVYGLLSAESSPWVSSDLSQEASGNSLELDAQRMRRCEAIYEADGETASCLTAPMTGAKRPSTTLQVKGKKIKVPKAGESTSTTFETFIFNSLQDDQLPLLTRDALESFPEMMENADIDVEVLLQDIEKLQE